MKARKVSRSLAARWRAQLDLFGEVAITRQDVYAWLLAVVDLDPSSARAFDYVRTYGVLNKIVRAKLDGTFDDLIAPAKHSARLEQLGDRLAVLHARNELGLGEPPPTKRSRLTTSKLRAPRRAAEVVREEHEREARAKAARRAAKATMLRRLPSATPLLSQMLADIGSPPPEALAGAMGVSVATAKRWISEDNAPRSVLFALFWLTTWGLSAVDAQAQNDAMRAAQTAAGLRRDLEELRAAMDKVGRIADFGSANDPAKQLTANATLKGYRIPDELRDGDQVPIVFDWMTEVQSRDWKRPRLARVNRTSQGDVPIVLSSIRKPRCAS